MSTGEWPPPKVKDAVLSKLSPDARDALWPSWREIDEKTRKLGRQLMDFAKNRPLKDLFPVLAVSSRGGLHMSNILSRPFGYGNPNIRFVGLSSYVSEGKEKGSEFEYGHLPDREDIEGQSVLLMDEVCDTGDSLIENKRLLLDTLGAASVTTAVLHYKPGRSQKSGIVPDFYVATTERWIVYPWEVYEIMGELALNESLWR